MNNIQSYINTQTLSFINDKNTEMHADDLLIKYKDFLDQLAMEDKFLIIAHCLPHFVYVDLSISPSRLSIIEYVLGNNKLEDMNARYRKQLLVAIMQADIGDNIFKISIYKNILNLVCQGLSVEEINGQFIIKNQSYSLLEVILQSLDKIWMIQIFMKFGLNIHKIKNEPILRSLFKMVFTDKIYFETYFRFFVENGVDIKTCDSNGNNAMFFLLSQIVNQYYHSSDSKFGLSLDHFKLLESYGLNVGETNYFGNTLLHELLVGRELHAINGRSYYTNDDNIISWFKEKIINKKIDPYKKNLYHAIALDSYDGKNEYNILKSFGQDSDFKSIDLGWLHKNRQGFNYLEDQCHTNKDKLVDYIKAIHNKIPHIVLYPFYDQEMIKLNIIRLNPAKEKLFTEIKEDLCVSILSAFNTWLLIEKNKEQFNDHIEIINNINEFNEWLKDNIVDYVETVKDKLLAHQLLRFNLNNGQQSLLQSWLDCINNMANVKNEVKKLIDDNFGIKKDEPKVIDSNDELTTNLYSIEDLANFKKLVQKMNEAQNSKNFIRQTDVSGFKMRVKTFAKSNTLLEKISELKIKFPHFIEVIEHIENYCILQNAGNGVFYLPPMLLGGGPGIGKTYFCHTVADIIKTYFYVFNMESMTSNFDFAGLSEGWSTAAPGVIFNTLVNEPNINPIFLLDEIDKTSNESKYNPTNALLPLLERYTASKFKDQCILLPIDASHIVWIATGNNLEAISKPILSRFDVFNVPNPNYNERCNIINSVYESILKNNSWGSNLAPILNVNIVEDLAQLNSPGAIRDIRRILTTACSKTIRNNRIEIAKEDLSGFNIESKMIWDLPLGQE